MNSVTSILTFSIAALLCSGCQSIAPAPVTPEVRAQAVSEMTPHYECILYHDQADNQDAVTASIDRGASIGEDYGLSPSELMSIYRSVRTDQERKVLQQANEFSSTREGVIPRISDLPPVPTLEEEQRAWETLYGERCKKLT